MVPDIALESESGKEFLPLHIPKQMPPDADCVNHEWRAGRIKSQILADSLGKSVFSQHSIIMHRRESVENGLFAACSAGPGCLSAIKEPERRYAPANSITSNACTAAVRAFERPGDSVGRLRQAGRGSARERCSRCGLDP